MSKHALVSELLMALERAVQLAEIASDWNLGTDGEIEIDGEWVSCYSLKQEFKAIIAKAKGGEDGE